MFAFERAQINGKQRERGAAPLQAALALGRLGQGRIVQYRPAQTKTPARALRLGLRANLVTHHLLRSSRLQQAGLPGGGSAQSSTSLRSR